MVFTLQLWKSYLSWYSTFAGECKMIPCMDHPDLIPMKINAANPSVRKQCITKPFVIAAIGAYVI